LESISKLNKDFDVVIIGGGIIGVALAIEIAKKGEKLTILLIEKEKAPGLHASGRNSGVIHAGFYYSPHSLKAKFCREGNIKLHETCTQLGVPLRRTGKVVIAQDAIQTPALEKLFHRGVENGVQVELHEDRYLSRFEPLAKSTGGFIWSPTTSVSDPKALISKLTNRARDLGVQFVFGSTPKFINGEVYMYGSRIKYRHLINSAGAQAIEIAHPFRAGKDYSIMPFLGTYAYLNSSSLPLRTLVYPLPHPVNPFLGVHFTITTDGLTKIGPSAIPVLGGEQYKFSDIPGSKDIMKTVKSAGAMAQHDLNATLGLIYRELPKMRIAKLVKEANKLVPSASIAGDWKRKPGGIRSQLVNLRTGELEQDFIVEATEHETHILNAVSPGWTSAIPFAEWIYQKYVLPSISTRNQ
jgi:L-2-hydroxyglutarate oxidase LhgO